MGGGGIVAGPEGIGGIDPVPGGIGAIGPGPGRIGGTGPDPGMIGGIESGALAEYNGTLGWLGFGRFGCLFLWLL